jgi:hypothetical protein
MSLFVVTYWLCFIMCHVIAFFCSMKSHCNCIWQIIELRGKIRKYIYLFNLIKLSWKGKAIPLQAWTALRDPGVWRFQTSRQSTHEWGKFVSPLHWPPLNARNIPGAHFCYLSQPLCHRVTGNITSMKNNSDAKGNRTHDPPARSAVPQPTAQPFHQKISLFTHKSKTISWKRKPKIMNK